MIRTPLDKKLAVIGKDAVDRVRELGLPDEDFHEALYKLTLIITDFRLDEIRGYEDPSWKGRGKGRK